MTTGNQRSRTGRAESRRGGRRTSHRHGALTGIWLLLVTGLMVGPGSASSARAQEPIRYTLEATVGAFDNLDPASLGGAQIQIVYEFDVSTAQSTTTSIVDNQGNGTSDTNYYNGLIGVISTTAELIADGSSYAGTITTNWRFRDAFGPTPSASDQVQFPPVTFEVAGQQIAYPGFTVDFDPAFVSGTMPFEFAPGDYTELQAQPLSYVEPASSAPLVEARLRGAFGSPDLDGDGIADDDDACPASHLAATVVIDGCDSGVANPVDGDGCTIADLIAEVAAGAANHGGFVSGVAHLLNGLKKDGVISGGDKGAIQRCAAQADLP